MRRPNSRFRGVFAWLVIRPKVVGLVIDKLGFEAWKWFRTLVNEKLSVAPTRPSFQTPISLTTEASRFHVGRPRRLPYPPQLVSKPRMQRRKFASTAWGL